MMAMSVLFVAVGYVWADAHMHMDPHHGSNMTHSSGAYTIANATADLTSLCEQMPMMTGCYLKWLCDEELVNGSFCSPYSLVRSICEGDSMGGMSGCSSWTSLCKSDYSPPDFPILYGDSYLSNSSISANETTDWDSSFWIIPADSSQSVSTTIGQNGYFIILPVNSTLPVGSTLDLNSSFWLLSVDPSLPVNLTFPWSSSLPVFWILPVNSNLPANISRPVSGSFPTYSILPVTSSISLDSSIPIFSIVPANSSPQDNSDVSNHSLPDMWLDFPQNSSLPWNNSTGNPDSASTLCEASYPDLPTTAELQAAIFDICNQPEFSSQALCYCQDERCDSLQLYAEFCASQGAIEQCQYLVDLCTDLNTRFADQAEYSLLCGFPSNTVGGN